MEPSKGSKSWNVMTTVSSRCQRLDDSSVLAIADQHKPAGSAHQPSAAAVVRGLCRRPYFAATAAVLSVSQTATLPCKHEPVPSL